MPILIAMFLILACLAGLEFFSIAWIWQKIGGVPTLVIVLGTGIIGALIARKNAKKALSSLLKGNVSNSGPAKQMFDTVAFFLAAALLIIPGILTDIIGLVILLPWTRNFLFNKYLKNSKADQKFSFGYRAAQNFSNARKKPLDDSDSVIDVQAEEVKD